MVGWIEEAISAGARKTPACQVLGFSIRTVQRWLDAGNVKADQRPEAERPPPSHALTDEERGQIIDICNQPDYASLPPSQIIPRMADKGIYIASESSFYRVLNAAGQLNHRGRHKARKCTKAPTTHIATESNQLWSWDISYLPSHVRGLYHYLYLVEDIYSRKIVGWEVHDSETGEYASELMQRTVLAEQCFLKPRVLHSDNGSPMKSHTLQSKLADLGITPSHSRPRVSNDNAYSESLFRTLKYCPQWPSQGFATLSEARDWVSRFVNWYNNDHRHSGIKFVTPSQRHRGEDKAILQQRNRVYEMAQLRTPRRWSRKTRDWHPVGEVTLNPESEEIAEAA